MNGWLLFRGSSPTAEEAVNCQWSLELELLLVEILYMGYHQCSYPGITADENILCFGGMAEPVVSGGCF